MSEQQCIMVLQTAGTCVVLLMAVVIMMLLVRLMIEICKPSLWKNLNKPDEQNAEKDL